MNYNPKETIIGLQTWSTQNLNVSHFRNGDTVPEVTTAEEWLKAGNEGKPACCYYNNDPENREKYGKLYNWYAVNDDRGLAPEGWKIPSNRDWKVLTKFLGFEDIAGIKMKASSGWYNNGNGTNESGFNGLPAGHRDLDGSFLYIGHFGIWWCADEYDANLGFYRYLFYGTDNVH